MNPMKRKTGRTAAVMAMVAMAVAVIAIWWGEGTLYEPPSSPSASIGRMPSTVGHHNAQNPPAPNADRTDRTRPDGPSVPPIAPPPAPPDDQSTTAPNAKTDDSRPDSGMPSWLPHDWSAVDLVGSQQMHGTVWLDEAPLQKPIFAAILVLTIDRDDGFRLRFDEVSDMQGRYKFSSLPVGTIVGLDIVFRDRATQSVSPPISVLDAPIRVGDGGPIERDWFVPSQWGDAADTGVVAQFEIRDRTGHLIPSASLRIEVPPRSHGFMATVIRLPDGSESGKSSAMTKAHGHRNPPRMVLDVVESRGGGQFSALLPRRSAGYFVVVQAPGLPTLTITGSQLLAAGPSEGTIGRVDRGDGWEITLTMTEMMRGIIVDEHGLPHGSAWVWLRDGSGTGQAVQADESGAFLASQLSGSEVRAWAGGEGMRDPLGHYGIQRGDSDPAAVDFLGRFTAADDATGSIRIVFPRNGTLILVLPDLPPNGGAEIVLRDGETRRLFKSGDSYHVRAGTYDSVWVFAENRAPAGPFSITVIANALTQLTAPTNNIGSHLQGRVTRPDGTPFVGSLSVKLRHLERDVPAHALPNTLRFDFDGGFVVSHLLPGHYEIVIASVETTKRTITVAPTGTTDIGTITIP